MSKIIELLQKSNYYCGTNTIEIAKGKYALSDISKLEKYKRYLLYKIWQVL